MRRTKRIDKFKFYDLVIYASRASHSARRIAQALGCRRWRDDLPERYTRRRPYFRGNSAPLVVNWGSTVPATWLSDPRFRLRPVWINSAEAVGRAIDKRAFFELLGSRNDIPVLKATVDKEEALKWLKKGYGVVARKTTTGSGGSGIVVVQEGTVLPDAPLYTRYYPKTHEFRAHVWGDKVIDFTQKRLKGGPNADANRAVRSLDNGWIHAHGSMDIRPIDLEKLSQASIKCVGACGLRFGAVDILAYLNEDRSLKSFKICEVNTGPGLENHQTITAYANAILATKESR